MSFQRKLRNLVEGPYGRWIMLGLLIFILAVFTVTQPMTQWIRSMFAESSAGPEDLAGSFSVLPGERTDVTFAEFDQARARYAMALNFIAQSAIDPVQDTEVWAYLLLAEAARREGVQVSYDEVRRFLERGVPAFIWNDPKQYKQWVRQRFRVSARVFEEALHEYLSALRLRELYQQSFLVAEPATREAVIKQAASQAIEYARGSYAALDAAGFLEDAARELKAESDPEQKLGEFYDTDPWVKLERVRFKNPRRYRIEVLYTIHKNVTDDATLQRIIDVFARTYPQLDVSRLEATVEEQKKYFRLYRDRLLAQAGSSWKDVGREVAGQGEEPGKKEGGGEEEEPGGEDGGAEAGEEAAGEGSGGAVTPALREKMWKYGFQIVKDQVDRELRLRGMYQWFSDQARDDESLRKLYDKLQKHDDPKNPVCSTEPGKGLIIYRDFGDRPLTGEELAEIEDSGVKFTHNFRTRVTSVRDSDLPKKNGKADVLGLMGNGRQIFRLIEVLREQRKTFDELTPGERAELRDEFYLPAKARERAKEKLEALRRRFVAGELETERFAEEARAIGCRVHEDEWIVASYDLMETPDPKFLWHDEYLHMRDRYFLRKHLAEVLSRDRARKELKEGSFLEVAVETPETLEDDLGAAYLYLLLERRKPDAETVPPSELTTFLVNARREKLRDDQRRWSERIEQLISDFKMVFYDDMRRRIDDELKRRAEARRRRAG